MCQSVNKAINYIIAKNIGSVIKNQISHFKF